MSCYLSSFGQINEPSSRAFWDDFDEEDDRGIVAKKLEWICASSASQSPIPVDTLLLVEGHNITDFVKQVLLTDSSQICKIGNAKVSLHKANGRSLIIGLIEENLSESGEVATLLLPYSDQAKKVITLTIQPKVEYKSDNLAAVKDEITFIRAVKSGVKGVRELEAPNFIAGAAAGISSYRVVKKLPVNSYIAYTDKSDLDTLSTDRILKLFKAIGISCPNKYEPRVKDDSHLYM